MHRDGVGGWNIKDAGLEQSRSGRRLARLTPEGVGVKPQHRFYLRAGAGCPRKGASLRTYGLSAVCRMLPPEGKRRGVCWSWMFPGCGAVWAQSGWGVGGEGVAGGGGGPVG